MTKIYIPSSGPGDWKALLADPEKHWARGYSARSLAHAWENSDGFPTEILNVLRQSAALRRIEPLLIFPEWKVPLPGGRTSSQNDVWVLAKSDSGLVSIAIEGKVEESFDKTVGEWKVKASKGKQVRLVYLSEVLGLSDTLPDSIYYQLLHRTASAVIEAERFGATQAVMIIHSFSPNNRWFEEFKAFVTLFKADAVIGILTTVEARNGLPLHLAWVHGDVRYLNA